MQKNVSGQRWIVFAFDRTDNTPVTGDAANITANLRLDGGAANAVDDTNPTELEDGFYYFDLTQAETNGEQILISPASSTADVQVIGVPGVYDTVPPNFSDMGIESDGDLTQVNSLSGHTAQTGDSYARLGAPAGASIAADLVTIDNFVDELESRLTAARAGYLDELSSVNIPSDIDTLLARLTAARAGYLDNLNGHTPQTGDSYARLGAPAGASVSADIADVPTVSEFNARTLVAADYFDPATDTVANVALVDTTTTNTDMRGTDGANTVTPPTAAQIRSEIDTNSTQLAAILLDTNGLRADDVPGLIAALNNPTSQDVVDDLMSEVLESGKTVKQALLDMWAVLIGNSIANDATNPTSITYDSPDGSAQRTHTLTSTTRTQS